MGVVVVCEQRDVTLGRELEPAQPFQGKPRRAMGSGGGRERVRRGGGL